MGVHRYGGTCHLLIITHPCFFHVFVLLFIHRKGGFFFFFIYKSKLFLEIGVGGGVNRIKQHFGVRLCSQGRHLPTRCFAGAHPSPHPHTGPFPSASSSSSSSSPSVNSLLFPSPCPPGPQQRLFLTLLPQQPLPSRPGSPRLRNRPCPAPRYLPQTPLLLLPCLFCKWAYLRREGSFRVG